MALSSFFVTFSIISIWLDRCDSAPYHYFGVGDVANSDGRAPLDAISRKIDVKPVVGYKSAIINKSTRGLFYPDDMFVTNWMATALKKEDCSEKAPSGSKCTLKAKNNEKSTHKKEKAAFTESSPPSSRRRSSTVTANTSPSRPGKAPIARPNSMRTPRKPTNSRLNSTKTPRKSTHGRGKSSKIQRKPTVAVDESFSKRVSVKFKNDERHKLTTSVHRSHKPRGSTAATTPNFSDIFQDHED